MNLRKALALGTLLLSTSVRLAVAHATEHATRSVAVVTSPHPSREHADVPPSDEAKLYPVPPPPFSEGIFPCSDCHDGPPESLARRELQDEHTNIVLEHGPRERWCFDCHNPDDRDQLRLASGSTVPFTESYRLCGQCHGPKLRDWRVGVHGKRTGQWDGKKRYLLCAHCHNPHSPRFKPLKPEPPPAPPDASR